MKKRVFFKKKIGALTLALLVVSPLVAVPVAQADDIYIEGGGGGGGGSNGTMATGGGGNGGFIGSPSGQNDTAGAGDSAGGSGGGTGGTGGFADANKDGADGGVGGTGLNNVAGGTGAVVSGASQSGGTGGKGGNATGDTTDMIQAGVGAGNTVKVLGGQGGQGGRGYDNGDGSGGLGGNGGDGGSASLTWNDGGASHTIVGLQVVAGASQGGQFAYFAAESDPVGNPGVYDSDSRYSGGGKGGSAAFDHTGDLEVTGDVNVQANGNSATFKNTGDLAVGGDTTVTATDSPASMTVTGNADLNTLTVLSTGGFGGDATFESNDLTAGATTVKSEGGAGNADMLVRDSANLTTLSVLSTGSGNAKFKSNKLNATGDITAQTTSGGSVSMDVNNEVSSGGDVLVQTESSGAATFTSSKLDADGKITVKSDGTGKASMTVATSVTSGDDILVQSTGGNGDATLTTSQLFSGGATTIQSTGTGHAGMDVSTSGSYRVQSRGTMSILAEGSGNASFTANNADTVEILDTGANLVVQSSGSGGGKASFEALNANVHIASGELQVDSSGTTNVNGTAIFHSKALNLGGLTTIHSGAALARATVDDAQLSIGNLAVTAGGNSASFEAPNATTFFVTTVNVNGDSGKGGDAKVIAEKAAINTQNFNVAISTADTIGGDKGIYAKSLTTGTASVTMTGTGSGDSSAQLVLSDFLRTPTLNLAGSNTAESVVTDIKNVDVSSGDTTFNFTNTVGSDDPSQGGVYFETISLGSADTVRTLTATGAGQGTFWAKSLNVYVHNNPSLSQNWVGNMWLGGSPGIDGISSTTGNVGSVNMILPAGIDLNDYKGSGDGANPNYMLAATGDVTVNDGAKFNLTATGGSNPFANLNKGDQYQFLSAGSTTDNTTEEIQWVSAAGSKDYVFALDIGDEALLARFVGTDDSIAKAYLEGNVAALGNLYQGADLISRTMRNTFDPYVQGDLFKKDGTGLGVMFGAEYAHQRLNAGSHVSSDYYNVVVGPALRAESGIGRLGLSVFFETGHGSYSTHNSFVYSHVVGDGDTDYYGGGIALRNDFTCGAYIDLTLRAGSVSTDLNLRGRAGASYDDSTTYVGGHVALGKIFDFAQNGRLDIYGGMLWTRLNSFSTTTDLGERIEFDAVDSMRSQLGGRYHYNFNKMVAGYAGAAWEYEFEGDVGGRLDGVRIDEPSLGGSTGKGELGVSIAPGKNLSIDLGVQGYTGKRQGAGGTATLTWTF